MFNYQTRVALHEVFMELMQTDGIESLNTSILESMAEETIIATEIAIIKNKDK